jgi:hypothetical protein
MKLREIDYSASQVLKIRTQLGDYITPVSELNASYYPCGHKRGPERHAQLVKRLQKHENRYTNLVNAGFIKWFSSKYKG